PPDSPLFPYTTLFRSNSSGNPYAALATTRLLFGVRGGYWLYDRGGLVALQAGGGLLASLSSTHYTVRDVNNDPESSDSATALKLDRKSTRLNSSHEWI